MTEIMGLEKPFADDTTHWSNHPALHTRTPEERLMIGMFWRAVADAHPRIPLSRAVRREARQWIYCRRTDAELTAERWPFTMSSFAEHFFPDMTTDDLRRLVLRAGRRGEFARLFGQNGRG